MEAMLGVRDPKDFTPYSFTISPHTHTHTMQLSKSYDLTQITTKQPTRYAFNCAQYNPEENTLTATDGRMLVRVPVESSENAAPDSYEGTSLIPREALTLARKGPKTFPSLIDVNHDNLVITNLTGTQSTLVHVQDMAEFPKVEAVIASAQDIKSVETESRVTVNSEYLLKIIKALGTPDALEIVLSPTSHGPIRLQVLNKAQGKYTLDGAFGVLMHVVID